MAALIRMGLEAIWVLEFRISRRSGNRLQKMVPQMDADERG
jgi:hypothetical protein